MEARALNDLLCDSTENDVSANIRERRHDSVLSEAVVRRYSSK